MSHHRARAPRSNRRLQALAEVGRLVMLGFDQDAILRHTTELLAQLLDCPYARLWSRSRTNGDLVLVATAGALAAPNTHIGLRRPVGTTTLNADVLASGSIYQTTRVEDDPRWFNRRIVEEHGLHSYVGVPLLVGEQRFGILTLLFPGERVIAGEDLELVEVVAAQAAAALAHARAYEDSERRAQRLAELNAVSRWVVSGLDRDEVLRRIVEAGQRILGVPYSRLWLLTDNGDELLQVSGAQDADGDGANRVPVVGSFFELAIRSREPIRTDSVLEHPQFLSRAFAEECGLASCVAMPILDGARPLGVLALMGPGGHSFSDEDLELLQVLAGFSASKIANTLAYAGLAESAAHLRRLYGAIACGVLVIDAMGGVVEANETAAEVLGVGVEQLRGRSLADWEVTAEDGQPLELHQRPGLTALGGRRDMRDLTVRLTRPNGEQRWLHVNAMPIFDANGEPFQAVSTFVDVTARKRAEAALSHQALHDGLTGLPNRTLLRDRLEQAIAGYRRTGAPLALLVMDLDRFKEVNDTLGHQYGDLLLQEVSRSLRGCLRESDTVARLGGDEFAVLLPGADAAAATGLARRLLDALSQSFVLQDYPVAVAASLGIAVCPDEAPDPDHLLRCADVAMYCAKRSGEEVAIYAPDLDHHSPNRLALLAELRVAIETDQLELHFQPKVRLPHGSPGGVEALVRWRHPKRGLLPPDEFVALAEQTGLIKPLTCWVIGAALDQACIWRQAGIHLPVAVNLSMKDLHDPSLPDTVAELLAARGLPAEWLSLEITENGLMAEPTTAMAALRRLRSMGVRVAMDDFGTGYSSLAYLKQLPLDELKIDRRFVREMATDDSDCAIVRSTIELAHSLGLVVVAEGVEDAETGVLLARLGCDQAQGYYYGRPAPAAELTRRASTAQPLAYARAA